MNALERKYKIERVCIKCAHSDQLFVSKRDAGFELVDIDEVYGKTCKMCGEIRFKTSYERPDLDIHLLKEWAADPELQLMEQDEDLLLADEEYLDSIFAILDTMVIPDYKRDLLMSALCIIIYDNTRIDDNVGSTAHQEQLAGRLIEALKSRIDKLRLANDWIMPYIKNKVYPQLGFDNELRPLT